MAGLRGRTRTRGVVATALAAAMLVVAWANFRPRVFGQAAKAPPADAKPEEPVGEYSLVTTVLRPSFSTHLLNPPIAIAVDGGTDRAPGEISATKPIPAEFAIEGFGIPRYECASTNPKLRGCEALDRTDLAIRDANTLGYHIVSHGAAVTLNVNLEVHDMLPVSVSTPNAPWHAREMIFVTLPKATPAVHFVSEVLVGEWNGEPIVFEVGKALPDSAKKGLEDLGVKQDLGEGVLYSFRVKEPPKKQE
ncbi:MAG TPA: hypothetical protein VHE33_17005 [Acidobacteriaceae bacterium]|nr:hypothetical protein [Acidobacteriaceae bacterium]